MNDKLYLSLFINKEGKFITETNSFNVFLWCLNVLNKIFNSKHTDIKEQKIKNMEDKSGPEIKKKLITNLISNINIWTNFFLWKLLFIVSLLFYNINNI